MHHTWHTCVTLHTIKHIAFYVSVPQEAEERRRKLRETEAAERKARLEAYDVERAEKEVRAWLPHTVAT